MLLLLLPLIQFVAYLFFARAMGLGWGRSAGTAAIRVAIGMAVTLPRLLTSSASFFAYVLTASLIGWPIVALAEPRRSARRFALWCAGGIPLSLLVNLIVFDLSEGSMRAAFEPARLGIPMPGA